MANSITIPVNINVNVNRQQLNNVSSQIEKSVNKIKGFKTKDFFAPITNGANTLSKGLSSVRGSVNNLSNSFAGLKRVAISALSLTSLIKVGKEMVELSSDLVEVQNVVDTVFGDMSDDINDFAQSALKSFGLTELQAKNFVSVFGGLLEASDIVGDAQKEMAINLTKLTGDVASFYNMDYDEVFNKLQSGLTGEVKAMRSFGVNMTITNLEAWALANGITKSYDAMNQAEKTALRYNYMLEKLSNAQGDFNKTQGSWANQTRILVSQIKQLGGILGGLLQKILYPILITINQIVSAAISGASSLAKMLGFDMKSLQVQQGVSDAGAGVALGDTGADAMDDLADSTDDAAKAQKKLNKEQKKSLANIHELNILQTDNSKPSEIGKTPNTGKTHSTGVDFDLSKYKDVSKEKSPVNKLFKEFQDAINKNDWEGLGSKLAEKINGIFSKIHLDKYIPTVKKWASNFAEALNGLTKNINFAEIGRVLGEGINLITAGVNAFFDKFDFVSLGQQIARGLNSLFDTVDFEALGQFLVNKFNAIFQTLAGFVTEFDWENLGIKLSEGINSIFNNFDFNSFSIAVYEGINGVFETIGTTILNLDWVGVAEKFAKSFSTIFSNIDYGLILTTIIKGIEGILLSISVFLSGIDWGSIFEQVKNGINTAINVLGDFDFATIAANLSTGLINMISGLAEMLKEIDWLQLGANIYNSIKDVFLNMDWAGLVVSILQLVVTALGALSATILPIIVGLVTDITKTLWGVSKYISEGIKSILALITEFLGNIIGLVIAKIAVLATNIANWFTTLVGNIGNWLANVISKVSEWFPSLISKLGGWLGSVLSSISSWFTGLVNKVGSWLGNVFSKISSWFSSLISKLGGWLGSVLSPIVSLGTKIWGKFTGFLQKIISYISGSFKTAWGSAWEGVKSVFSGIFETIGGVFKGIINTVIGAINAVIGAINKLHWDVPDWVPKIGGKKFGFNIEKIPKLANGAVIPPNQEFLAVLGDQKRGVNIETPLETMLQAFRGALAEVEIGGTGDIVIPIYINNELTSEEVIRKQEIARYRSNGK